MQLSAGAKLGPYELLAPIGKGGMGEVWKARDPRLNRDVAIKISEARFSERFEREARAIAALNHPHICQIYDVGPNYLVMELIEGAPVKGPLPVEKAAEYASQILDALDAAHIKGITHRDLKPANIMATKQGIKLLDFGLAKQAGPVENTDSTVTQGLTGQGQILGTLQYMAPEQLQGKAADARSDLFAFGCVLYEMLTGKRAFEGATAASVIAAILEREPAPLPSSLTGAGAPLERLLARTLQKDPERRFQTARDLKTALEWALEPAQPATAPVIAPRRWWIVSLGALLLGALAAWSAMRFRAQPDATVLRLDINPPADARFAPVGVASGGSSLSPDGRMAAISTSVNGKTGLWIRALGDSTGRLLPATDGAYDPFWSPDGKSVGFFAGGKLQRVDLSGGAPLIVSEAPSAVGGAWAADGRIVFGTLSAGLFQVPAAGGKPARITTLDMARAENTHRMPQILPGNRLLYFARSEKPEYTGEYLTSLARPAERTLLRTAEANAIYAPGADGRDYLLWLQGGTLMAQELDIGRSKLLGDAYPIADPVSSIGTMGAMVASASKAGQILYRSSGDLHQLTWFDRSGRMISALGEPSSFNWPFRISPDGRRVAASVDRNGGNDLWLLDVERGVPARFTSASQSNVYPVWSPDGRTIVFTRDSRDLFRKEVNGAGDDEQRVFDAPTPAPWYATDWSRDGRFLLRNEAVPEGQLEIGVIPIGPDGKAAHGASPFWEGQSRFEQRYGRFSTETSPHWIAYQSNESNRDEVYIRAFPQPRAAFQISTEGGRYPEWGPGGRELFYVDPDNRLMAVELSYVGDQIRPSKPRVLFSMPIIDNGWAPYDVSADGQKFLVRATARETSQALTALINWPALLKKPQ